MPNRITWPRPPAHPPRRLCRRSSPFTSRPGVGYGPDPRARVGVYPSFDLITRSCSISRTPRRWPTAGATRARAGRCAWATDTPSIPWVRAGRGDSRIPAQSADPPSREYIPGWDAIAADQPVRLEPELPGAPPPTDIRLSVPTSQHVSVGQRFKAAQKTGSERSAMPAPACIKIVRCPTCLAQISAA